MTDKTTAPTSADLLAVRESLTTIATWNLPRWVDSAGVEMSWGTAFGSNGERDYMRNLAYGALKLLPAAPVAPHQESAE